VPWRKVFLEKAFGFGEVRWVGPKGPRGAAKFDLIVERISVHNVMGDQQIRGRAGVTPNLATCGQARTEHPGRARGGEPVGGADRGSVEVGLRSGHGETLGAGSVG
jgi:hypothetical protein